MKKILLTVAILMLATPAFAVTVDITLRAGDDVNQVEVWYDVTDPVLTCPDGRRPRAFGLNITTGGDANIIDINVPFEGECDDVNRGYGIFPGTISIADGEVTGWGGPIAPGDDPGAEGTGLDTNTIIIEMGSLYAGANCPDPCAMLFFIVVNMDCDVSISGDAARTGTGSGPKGVILENLGAVTVNWPPPYLVRTPVSVPDVTAMDETVATAAIVAAGLIVDDVTYECDDVEAADEILAQDPIGGTMVSAGSPVDLWVSTGSCCTYPDCWDWPKQCHGDTVGNDQQVVLADFFVFKDAYGKNYWDHYPLDDQNIQPGEYHPCADYDRNGSVELADFFVFKDSFQVTDVSGYPVCDPVGDPCEVYCPPGSVKP